MRKKKTLFTTQPNLHVACNVILPAASQKKIIDNVCTSTTVPLLPRRTLVRFGRNQKTRFLCLTECGRPACTAAEEARDAGFVTICLPTDRSQHFCGKLVLSHVK